MSVGDYTCNQSKKVVRPHRHSTDLNAFLAPPRAHTPSRKEVLRRSASIQKLELERMQLESSINSLLTTQFTRQKAKRTLAPRTKNIYREMPRMDESAFSTRVKSDMSFKEDVKE